MSRRFLFAIHLSVLALVGLMLLPASAIAQSHDETVTAAASVEKGRPIEWRKMIKPDDRILFLGDEITQQGFYTRAVADAFLTLMPKGDLRVFNGGKDGATTASALKDVEELLAMTKPTVVFIQLGLNDAMPKEGQADTSPASVAQDFHKNLTALVERLQQSSDLREIIILGPAAVQSGMDVNLDSLNFNDRLAKISDAGLAVAAERKVSFIDLFPHTHYVFEKVDKNLQDPLTLRGRVPSEEAHIIIASIILKGLGVTEKELEPLGWSPLPSRKMGRIRTALALRLEPPSVEAGRLSNEVYEALRAHDEAFFKAWRLAGKSPSTPSREMAMTAAVGAWSRVRKHVAENYGKP